MASDASVRAAAASSGTGAIDVLKNVAGVIGPFANELEGADWDAWNEAFAIMVQGPQRAVIGKNLTNKFSFIGSGIVRMQLILKY